MFRKMEMEKDLLELSANGGSAGLMLMFSWDGWDNHTDSLPMLDTIAWPLGKHLIKHTD